MLFDFVSHPYSFYLHDPENRVLQELIEHIRSKEQPVWIGTLRDVIRDLLGDQG